jgi:hypothetical protein
MALGVLLLYDIAFRNALLAWARIFLKLDCSILVAWTLLFLPGREMD